MTLLVKKGTITMPTTTQSVAVTGVGFEPKAIIFWCSEQTATGNAAQGKLSVGFATSSSQRKCLTIGSADAVTVPTTQNVRLLSSNRCLIPKMTPGGTPEMTLDLTSMDPDGFTVALTVPGTSAAVVVHYLALGGSDISNAFVGGSQPSAGSGSKAITGVGFIPDFVLMLTANNTAIDSANTAANISISAFTASKSATTALRDQNVINSNTGNYQAASVTSASITSSADTLDNQSTFTSMDADGFTLNFSARTTQSQFLYLCLKGGQYSVDVETQKTSAGTKSKTGVGFSPVGLFLFGANGATNASLVATQAKITVGGTDGTSVGSTSMVATDNLATTDANSWLSTTRVFQHVTNPATTDAEASLTSLDADGYTLDWTAADATAREFIGIAFGSVVSWTPETNSPKTLHVVSGIGRW